MTLSRLPGPGQARPGQPKAKPNSEQAWKVHTNMQEDFGTGGLKTEFIGWLLTYYWKSPRFTLASPPLSCRRKKPPADLQNRSHPKPARAQIRSPARAAARGLMPRHRSRDVGLAGASSPPPVGTRPTRCPAVAVDGAIIVHARHGSGLLTYQLTEG